MEGDVPLWHGKLGLPILETMMSTAITTDHLPNIHHLEIHITYVCNLACAHCHNLAAQAPSSEMMPAFRVELLLRESARLHWPWAWIVLHGGEPTLHPELHEICTLLHDYKWACNHGVKLAIVTNGRGEKVTAGIEIARQHGLVIENSHKEDGHEFPSGHVPVCSSPEDAGEDYHLGCFQSSQCGIAYTNRGFYECSPAASAWRVFGYAPLATELRDVTAEKLAAGFATHCRHCGYARKELKGDPRAPMSKTWAKAIEKYKALA